SATWIFTLSLHDALPISANLPRLTYNGFTETVALPLTRYLDRLTSTSKNLSHRTSENPAPEMADGRLTLPVSNRHTVLPSYPRRSEEHTSELQSRSDLVC